MNSKCSKAFLKLWLLCASFFLPFPSKFPLVASQDPCTTGLHPCIPGSAVLPGCPMLCWGSSLQVSTVKIAIKSPTLCSSAFCWSENLSTGSATSLGNFFLNILWVEFFFLTFILNLLPFHLKPFPIVLSLSVHVRAKLWVHCVIWKLYLEKLRAGNTSCIHFCSKYISCKRMPERKVEQQKWIIAADAMICHLLTVVPVGRKVHYEW